MKVEFVKSLCVVKDMQDHFKVISTCVGIEGLYKLDVTSKSDQVLASITMTI